MFLPRFTPLVPLILLTLGFSSQASVVLNEIHYHPASELVAEEFIELANPGTNTVLVAGWRLSGGIDFTFPANSLLPAGGFLVVCADPTAFSALHPSVTNFVHGLSWTGRLSNASDTLVLRDALGGKQDEVTYADDGDWGVRRRDSNPDFGHRGWTWSSPSDGEGASLELRHPLADNAQGQNWAASGIPGGTPGAANSVLASNLPPLITDTGHFPLVPGPSDTVAVTCQVADPEGTPVSVSLASRLDGTSTFTEQPMRDDGTGGDLVAGDRLFTAVLPAQANGSVVEFHVVATDGSASRTWPAPAVDYTGVTNTFCNALYAVDGNAITGDLPLYRLVLTSSDRTELSNINTDTGTPPFAFNPDELNDQTYSHAKFNATWITRDGTGWKCTYTSAVRNRGNGSRQTQPQSFAVSFPHATPWNGRVAFNLNSQHTPYQWVGSDLFRAAGLAMAESRAVHIRLNATNPAGTGSPSYGFYSCNEAMDSEFAAHHFPQDNGGNLYRALRVLHGATAGGTVVNAADLGLVVPAPGETLSQAELYQINYFKHTNESEDQWSDLIDLTAALAKGTSGATPDAPIAYEPDYVAAVTNAVDVGQWMRFFAVNALADNSETNISSGDGDDYFLYLGALDPRARLIPFDLDTILGRSAGSNSATHDLFRMTVSVHSGNPPTPLNAFMKHPDFAPVYYEELIRLLDGLFLPSTFNAAVQARLNTVAPPSVISAMQTFNANRHAYVSGQVPRVLSVSAVQSPEGVTLPVLNGYSRSVTNALCRLVGRSHAARTRSVRVDGQPAVWSAWNASWTAPAVTLDPGVNRVLIQAFDSAGVEFERAYQDVWLDDLNQTTVSGTLASSQTWTAANGPYRIDGALTIPSGVTLSIEAGTSLWLGNSASTVNVNVGAGGRLLAEGTETAPIRFMLPPGATYTWGGIVINGQLPLPAATRIAHAFISGNNATAIHSQNEANIELEHIWFLNPGKQYLSLDDTSFLISHCVLPDVTGSFEPSHGTGGIPAGGRGIIRDCYFGKAIGYNDVFDFTGGNRPAPILQMIGNVFSGSGDDILDLDGCDAWIEGNIFMNVHRLGSPDSASAVSGGSNAADESEITVLKNFFVNMDQAATAKQGNFYTLLHNTVYDQNGVGSEDAETGVINLSDEGYAPAAGMFMAGNVFWKAVELARHYDPVNGPVTFTNNTLALTWPGPGGANSLVDPQLRDPGGLPTPTATTFTYLFPELMRRLSLGDCSPARGAGLLGYDRGATVPYGVLLEDAPSGTTSNTFALVRVGPLVTDPVAGAPNWPSGSGYTHYKYRLDGGAWSTETSASQPITLSNLPDGPHVLEVSGKNDAGFYQDHPDFGPRAQPARAEWVVDSGATPTPVVRLNEVLASNLSHGLHGTVAPDYIELWNSGSVPVVLDGWGLTDNPLLPHKYVFPTGTSLAPGAFLVLAASGNAAVPAPKTGFSLKAGGDSLGLSRPVAQGGGLVDEVVFGLQLPDFSLSRCPDGAWTLAVPTLGAANQPEALDPPRVLRINEWLSDPVHTAGQDFVEILNTGDRPVDLGGCTLTDNPAAWPDRHRVAPYSFIAAGGYLAFKADHDPGQGADHLPFRLSPEQGEIGLFAPDGAPIDVRTYGPQSTDVSQGRTPNGADSLAFFPLPTPGGPNPGAVGGVVVSTNTVNLIAINQAWKYRSSAVDYSSVFYAPAFDDSGWASGGQLLHIENSPLPSASGFTKTTALPVDAGNQNRPFQTTYFRTHFNLAEVPVGAQLRGVIMVDDGAVFYLNGQEILPTNTGGARLHMPSGAITFNTVATDNISNATEEPIAFTTAGLQAGDNVLALAVHQEHPGTTQSSSDVVLGLKLDLVVTTTNSLGSVVLSEVLVRNEGFPAPDSPLSAWVELHNPNPTPVSLEGMGLSNEISAPRRHVFPAGTLIPPQGFALMRCDPLRPSSSTNAPFALNPDGGALFLTNRPADGGSLQDSLAYGRQIPDHSLGRVAGVWALNMPTPGATNVVSSLGSISDLRLNEWAAAPAAGLDFLELYNTSALPVAVGGLSLTDHVGDRFKSGIPPLSFIAGQGAGRWQLWIADGDSAGTPGHVNFNLSAQGGALGLFQSDGQPVDSVAYTPVTAGRYADGASAILPLLATPGFANQLPSSDADSDGMDDAWETANGFNPGDAADAALDADGDGHTNLQEFLAGTNPRDASDILRASVAASGANALLRVRVEAGRSYTVQFKDDLADAVWQTLSHLSVQAAAGEVEVLDPAFPVESRRYYRVVTPAQP